MLDSKEFEIIEQINTLNYRISYSDKNLESGFLRGVYINKGTLEINEETNLNDILHEIGHLNLLPSCLRYSVYGDLEERVMEFINTWTNNSLSLIEVIDQDWYKQLDNGSDQAVIAYVYARLFNLEYPVEYCLEEEDSDMLGSLKLDSLMLAVFTYTMQGFSMKEILSPI